MANRIFIISDTHFGHKMLVENGYRPARFEENIIRNIRCLNLDISDVMYHLGDVSVCPRAEEGEWHRRFLSSCLDAKVVLVRGNHDSRSNAYYYERGYSAVVDACMLNVYGWRVYLSHEPVEPVGNLFDFNVHGHLHDNQHRNDEFPFMSEKNVLYSCEVYKYRPILLKSLLGM